MPPHVSARQPATTHAPHGTRGTGGMTHADPDNRPKEIFDNTVTLHAGGPRESYLLLPIIPPK